MTLPPPVADLLERVASDDPGAKDDAMRQLGLLLEKHSRLANSPGLYESILRPEVFRLTLTAEDQREVVARLGALVAARRLTPNILMWALGTPAGPAALSQLLKLLAEQGHELDEETLVEALRAAERFLPATGGVSPDEPAAPRPPAGLTPSLEHLTHTGSASVQGLAREVLRKISH